MARLGEICTINMGQSPDSSTYNQNKNGLPFFQGNADFGDVFPAVRLWCSNPIKVAKKNDILISVRAPIGALNISTCECCIGRGLASLSVNQEVCNQKYLWYVLSSKVNELNSKGTGSTFKAISKQTLSETEIPLPPMEEQKKIAAVLDKVSDLIAKRRRQLDKLDLLVKARFVERFGEPGTKKSGLQYVPLDNICLVNPKKNQESKLKDGLQVSFVPMSFVTETGDIDASCVKDYNEVKTGFTYFAENDVLFAKITPCMENGKGAIAKNLKNGIGFGSTEFHVLRPIDKKSDPYWLYILTSFKQFRDDAASNMTGSAGQRRVPASFLEKYLVSVPPFELQKQFSIFVQYTEQTKTSISHSLETLETLKKSLMQEYFG